MASGTSSAEAATWGPNQRGRLAELLGIALNAYKASQVERRLEGFMRARSISGPEELLRRLQADPGLVAALRNYLTIHVTAFFRDPAYWEHLGAWIRQREWPGLWRVWCAASSTGAEPLSLAALFAEAGRAVQILASDIDPKVLAVAQTGRYRAEEVAGLAPSRRERLFQPAAEPGVVEVRTEIRRRLRYMPLDLLRDPYPPGPFDLISCRNVLIYFGSAERDRVVGNLVARLAPEGALFVGASEVLLYPQAFGLRSLGSSLYVRNDGKTVAGP